MSAAATAPDPRLQPDPNRAGENVPSRIGRLFRVIRKLIDYGKEVASTLQQRASVPEFYLLAGGFGTLDLARIIARITCGLQRAAALEARLREHAATGRDVEPAPTRKPSVPKPSPPKPRTAQAAAARPAAPAPDPRLACLPTAQEIAEDVRRRPIGAVIADICRDLGMTPAVVERELWHELTQVIEEYGGNLFRLCDDITRRVFHDLDDDELVVEPPTLPPGPLQFPVFANARPP